MIHMLLLAALTLSAGEKQVEFDGPSHNAMRNCSASKAADGFCRLPLGLTAAQASEKLPAGKDTVFWREADQFVVVARRDTDQAYFCCSARGRMDRLGGNLWGLRLRIDRFDEAVMDILVVPGGTKPEPYRGPKAPSKLAFNEQLKGTLRVVTIDSKWLGKPRKLTIYTPPGFDPTKRYPVVYEADGVFRLQEPGFLEPQILAGSIPAFVSVGIWPDTSTADSRSQEYLVGYQGGEEAFRRHENFFLKEVMPLAESRYGASADPDQRLITGFSSGSAWAVQMGLRHKDQFHKVAAFSFAWDPAISGADHPGRPALFLSGGTLEPVFHRTTSRLAATARRSGDPVVFEEPVGGHTQSIWIPKLAEAIRWAFGASTAK